jgi:hypothetical protein
MEEKIHIKRVVISIKNVKQDISGRQIEMYLLP